MCLPPAGGGQRFSHPVAFATDFDCVMDVRCLQVEDKDLPILSHLQDIHVVRLRDEQPTSSTKSEDEDDDEDDTPKVIHLCHCCCESLCEDTQLSFCCGMLHL